ncbi:MAG: NAD(P)-binding domain-containing protein [Planctomycetota bacterium]|nr:NAD(P)-binding domain-containing protein [Planctomycetota bacterium]
MILRVITAPIRRPFAALAHWLHTRWPAGTVEQLPVVQADGSTNVSGLVVVGDLLGISLLKLSADSGARAIQGMLADPQFQKQASSADPRVCDVLIVGAGISGMAAALEADKAGLRYELLEGTEPFSTVRNFPTGKPIYAYPTDMEPTGGMRFTGKVKETLLDELRAQTLERGIRPTRRAVVEKIVRHRPYLEAVIPGEDPVLARRVVVAIGRTGNFRQLGVAGEDLPKVGNRLFDPKDFHGQRVLVVGGGDSALEAAIAIARSGGDVDLSYRQSEFSRPKTQNIAAVQQLQRNPAAVADGTDAEHQRAAGNIDLHMDSRVGRIDDRSVTLQGPAGEQVLPNDAVLTMIGREAPLDFFRRSGVRIRGETRGLEWLGVAAFFLFIWLLYDWKNYGIVDQIGVVKQEVLQGYVGGWLSKLAEWWNLRIDDRSTLLGTLAVSMGKRSFYYTLLYTICIGWFGLRRVLRRRTPYVTLQTSVLFLVQLLPLFLLPELLLPWLGYNGVFDTGWAQQLADGLFEASITPQESAAQQWPDGDHPRAYWRAYGFILAFPLLVYNVLNSTPLGPWLWISAIQTFLIIPLIVWKWGKGAFCGWICSCGGLAETMGDAHRHKMFHGEVANRFNMVGQVILLLAFTLLGLRIWGWVYEGGAVDQNFWRLIDASSWFSYLWLVDVAVGGVLGVGLYFKYSGRIWCRFACPLAALMHFYARFSRFRILSDKDKCISCNACTSNCHMGVDVMNFANKGAPMEDPECVRCGACVQVCPTGVLEFGEVDGAGEIKRRSWLSASSVAGAEGPQSADS